jgi:hypothetical protein
LPIPCLYVGLEPRPIAFPGGQLHPRRRTGRALRAIIDACAEAAEASMPPGAARTAARVVAALPRGAQLNCLGFMLARPNSPLRLSLELPSGELEGYLGALGWKGAPGDLRLIRSLLAHGVDRLALAIDAGVEVGPRLGIELFYHRPPSVDRRFGAVLDDLASRGLCAPAKAAALRGWRGAIDVPGGRLERTVYHVKIVLDSAAQPLAKSYLWLTAVAPQQRPVD